MRDMRIRSKIFLSSLLVILLLAVTIGGFALYGADVVQWTYGGGDNQLWSIADAGGGYVKLVAKHSGKLLTVADASTTDGANIYQWEDTGGAHQQWKLETP